MIAHFTRLIDIDWKDQASASILSTRLANKNKNNTNTADTFEDPLKILATKLISEANVKNQSQFVFSIQLDVCNWLNSITTLLD